MNLSAPPADKKSEESADILRDIVCEKQWLESILVVQVIRGFVWNVFWMSMKRKRQAFL